MTHCSWKLVAISKRIVRSGPDRFGDRLAAARCYLDQCPGELRQLGVALDAAELPRGTVRAEQAGAAGKDGPHRREARRARRVPCWPDRSSTGGGLWRCPVQAWR